MPVAYRRKLPVPMICHICGREIPGRFVHPGPPRTICRRQQCETRRDALTRARRAKEPRS